jgi:SAM-dependent methyltransferase
MLKKIITFFEDPRIKYIDYDSDEVINTHRTILQEKTMMNNVFSHFYKRCIDLDKKFFSGDGKRIEIGGGVTFFNKLFPDVLISDIKKSDNFDLIIDAQQMNLSDKSVRAIYGINCFHHFPEPRKFFDELERVLVTGGGCVLIDPYYGPLAKILYPNLYNTESFDISQKEWNNINSGVMIGANQAKSYIVFVRDREEFIEKFPGLEIVYHKPLNNYLQYLLSGGLNFRQLVPDFLIPSIKFFEFLLTPVSHLFALHHIIVIRKNGAIQKN